MATQRLTVATLAGESVPAVAGLVRSWRGGAYPDAVDRFCDAVRANGSVLPIIYYCEWVDRWLMGDLVPGPGAVQGRRYQLACLSAEEAVTWAGQCGHQFREQEWLVRRLREAADCRYGDECRAVVVVRELLDVSMTDEQVEADLGVIPDWLSWALDVTEV